MSKAKPNAFPDLVIHNWLILSLVALETDPGLWRSWFHKTSVQPFYLGDWFSAYFEHFKFCDLRSSLWTLSDCEQGHKEGNGQDGYRPWRPPCSSFGDRLCCSRPLLPNLWRHLCQPYLQVPSNPKVIVTITTYQAGPEELVLRGLRGWGDHAQLEHQVSARSQRQNSCLWSRSHHVDHQHNNVSMYGLRCENTLFFFSVQLRALQQQHFLLR